MHSSGMRIILIHPRVPAQTTFERIGRSHLPPLGLLYIASALMRAGHQVKVLDLNLPQPEDLASFICAHQPDLVGLGSLSPAFDGMARLAQDLRDRLPPGTPLIAGGADVTTSAARYQRLDCFDALFVGEAEYTLPSFCASWPTIPDELGIIPRGADTRRFRRPPMVSPDHVPFPARHLLPVKNYRGGPAFKRQLHSTSIFTHRGCPYSCTFCEKGVHIGPMRFRSAESILEEVRQVKRDHGITDIRFIDDVFMVNRKVLDQFLELVLRSGEKFKWLCTARVDHMREPLLR